MELKRTPNRPNNLEKEKQNKFTTIGVDICCFELGNGFLNMTPKTQARKEKKRETESKCKTLYIKKVKRQLILAIQKK